MNLSIVANEDIGGMDIRVAENVIERSHLKPPSQPFRPRDNLVYPARVLPPEGSELRGDRVLELRGFDQIKDVPDQCGRGERKGLDGKPAAEILCEPTRMNGLQRRPELTPLVIAHPGDHRILAGDEWV